MYVNGLPTLIMNKNELHILAQKYLDGNATPQEKQLLDDWYNTVQTGTTAIVELKNDESETGVKQRMLDNLNQQLFAEPQQQKAKGSTVKRLLIWMSSAAAVLALAFLAWSYYTVNADGSISDKQIVSVPTNRVMHLNLPDGSKVWLNAGSVFKYPKSFAGKTRTVELVEGRAFFDIKHQTEHPFIVKTKNLNITVLGTSFDVRSYKKEGTIRVAVVTGKVGITMPGAVNKQAIMLLPRQQIVLSNVTQKLTLQTTHENVVNSWCNVFEQEKLANVFKVIEKQYHTKITVEDKSLLEEPVTITLDNQHLDSVIKILSFTKHFKYKMANDSTVIVR